MGQITSVAAGLTKGGQHTAVRLLVALPQINILSLLLNQDAGVCNITVNEAGVVQLDGEFKGNIFFRLFNAVNLLQERQPECLRFLFFIARPFQSAANLAAARRRSTSVMVLPSTVWLFLSYHRRMAMSKSKNGNFKTGKPANTCQAPK